MYSDVGRIGVVSFTINIIHILQQLTQDPALNGSKHAQFLLHHKLLRYTSSPILDEIYSRNSQEHVSSFSQPPNTDAELKAATSGETMLLTDSSAKQFAKALDFPEIGMEVDRAVRQVQKLMRAKKELKEEKEELDRVKAEDVSEVQKEKR